MRCANHTDRDAIRVCNHCGRSICEECHIEIESENYCKDCVSSKLHHGKSEERSPALAAILSFIVSGTGQFYNGQLGKGIFFFFTSWLIIPWIIGILDAYASAKKINEGKIAAHKRLGCLLAAFVSVFVFWIFVILVAIIAAITIPLSIARKISAQENAAQSQLKLISAALESYSVENNGNYPTDEEALLNAKIPYLSGTYNHKTISGYTFTEEIEPRNYRISATPQECGVTGNNIFVIETGGTISSYDCFKNENGTIVDAMYNSK